jgi:hypothetical protein
MAKKIGPAEDTGIKRYESELNITLAGKIVPAI